MLQKVIICYYLKKITEIKESRKITAMLFTLQYACDLEAEVIGKPSKSFFTAVLSDMGVTSDKVAKVCQLK